MMQLQQKLQDVKYVSFPILANNKYGNIRCSISKSLSRLQSKRVFFSSLPRLGQLFAPAFQGKMLWAIECKSTKDKENH